MNSKNSGKIIVKTIDKGSRMSSLKFLLAKLIILIFFSRSDSDKGVFYIFALRQA